MMSTVSALMNQSDACRAGSPSETERDLCVAWHWIIRIYPTPAPTHPATWQIRRLAILTASMWEPLTLKPILYWDMNSSGGLPCVNSVMIFIRFMIHPTHNCHKIHLSAHSYAGITHEYLHGANESNYKLIWTPLQHGNKNATSHQAGVARQQ